MIAAPPSRARLARVLTVAALPLVGACAQEPAARDEAPGSAAPISRLARAPGPPPPPGAAAIGRAPPAGSGAAHAAAPTAPPDPSTDAASPTGATPKSETPAGDLAPLAAAAVGGAAPAKTLAERLREDIGRGHPVVILPGAKGVVAMSSDGSRARPIGAGSRPVAPYAVLVDPRAEVVWFQVEQELRAVDLRSTDPDPAPVVVAAAGEKLFARMHVRHGGPREELGAGRDPELVLSLPQAAFLDGAGHPCATADPACPKLTPTGRALVSKLRERAAGKHLERPGGHRPGPAVDVGSECDGCATSEKIPGTDLLAVVTETCVDHCHTHLGLYRPAATPEGEGRFVDPAHRAEQAEPFPFDIIAGAWVCPGGEVFVDREGAAVRLAGGTFDAGGRSGTGGGGCLDGGWFYPTPPT